MSIPAGQYLGPFVDDLTQRMSDVASQLYDLDRSTSVAILADVDRYVGRTREVLKDVAQDRTWLWPAYTEARSRLDLALAHSARREWNEARAQLTSPLELEGAPPHEDLAEAVTMIADTARAVLEVTLLVGPKIGEHLGALAGLRSRLGALEEDAAAVGLTQAPEVRAARAAVDDAFQAVTADPLTVEPTIALSAVNVAADLVGTARDEMARLPRRLGQADQLVLELEVLVERGRQALTRTREKIARPEGLLKPLAPDVLDAGPQGLRPWLGRLSRAAAEGDNRAALHGMRSWERVAGELRERAQQIVDANAAPLARRDELRGLVGALRAKAAATGLAEDATAEAHHEAARELLWVAPCNLGEAEQAVEAYRRFLVDR